MGSGRARAAVPINDRAPRAINHLPMQGQPAYDRMMATIQAFLPAGQHRMTGAPDIASLGPRERELLAPLARGLDNA